MSANTCIVKGCGNSDQDGTLAPIDQGRAGYICGPCIGYLKSGKVGPTNSFLKLAVGQPNGYPNNRLEADCAQQDKEAAISGGDGSEQ